MNVIVEITVMSEDGRTIYDGTRYCTSESFTQEYEGVIVDFNKLNLEVSWIERWLPRGGRK